MQKIYLLIVCLLFSTMGMAQRLNNGELKLDTEGSKYLKLTLLSQLWLRYEKYNPGSVTSGYPIASGFDIGIRRYRVQLYGQLTDRVFFYSQFGENNFNHLADRKQGFFVHDVVGEYDLVKDKLTLGAGLTGWVGSSRFSSPSVGSILGIDAPLFLQSTNDVTDQFLRKLAVYAKGAVGKLSYRLSVADPLVYAKSAAAGNSAVIGTNSSFSRRPAKAQLNAYGQYQFKDKESNKTPYMTGTYLGDKKVFNLGAGIVFQPNAMWRLEGEGDTRDTATSNLLQVSADAFWDGPVGQEGAALSLYGNATYFDFRKGYLRNLAVMNPVSSNATEGYLNGSGIGFPAYGTGMSLYGQVGYKLARQVLGTVSLMPYMSVQYARYDRLKQAMNFADVGINALIKGHSAKATLAYQNRPLYDQEGELTGHRGGLLLQYQVYFN